MRKIVCLLSLLFICAFVSGSSFAQKTPEEAPPPPSPPEVNVYNNRLSVNAEDAEFGAVMDDIARKAGFEVKIGSDIYTKRVSTNFRNMLLERGINRLLDLIGQKTYFIHYGPEGDISKIEVFSSGPRGTVQPERRAPWRPPTGPTRSAPVPPRRGMRMSVKERPSSVNESNSGVSTVPSTTVPLTPPPFEPDARQVNEMEEPPEFMEPSDEEEIEPLMDEPVIEDLEEEQAEEPVKAPYIPPRRAPSFVPKRPN